MLTNHPGIRTGIYIVGLAAQVASFFAPVWYPDLAQPLGQTADFLGVIAIGTAVSNLAPKPDEPGKHAAE